MSKRYKIWSVVKAIFLILVAIWGCFCMIHGFHTENVCETVIGCTFWLYGLITMQLTDIAENVTAGTILAGISFIRAADPKEKEDANVQ